MTSKCEGIRLSARDALPTAQLIARLRHEETASTILQVREEVIFHRWGAPQSPSTAPTSEHMWGLREVLHAPGNDGRSLIEEDHLSSIHNRLDA